MLFRSVKLWERTDKDVTPEMIGRVRSAEFFIYETDDELPAEISKLKYIETLYFSGNINKDRKDLHIGSCLNDLKHLKYLTVTGHGLVELPSELADIKTLEYLNISGNNFVEIPAILNPTDMPSLKHLDFSLNKRNTFDDDKALVVADKMGLYMNISRDHNDARRLLELLSWENLETLRLGNNYIEGELPDLNDFPVKYTAEEVNANDTLPSILIGMPKILPNAKTFSINLNRLTGNIPDWILYHPNLWLWDPYTLIFSQDLGMNTDGVRVRFDNVPSSWEYYYEQYPLRRPVLTD